MSAVMARLPATISPMRCAGTPISLAIRYFVIPSGSRNSSFSNSPGVTGSIVLMDTLLFMASPFSMIITNFDSPWSLIGPHEAYSVLVIYADGMLSRSVAFQLFQSVAWWHPQIIKTLGNVKLCQFAQSDSFKLDKLSNTLQSSELFSFFVCKRLYHALIITQCVINVKRYCFVLQILGTPKDKYRNRSHIPTTFQSTFPV